MSERNPKDARKPGTAGAPLAGKETPPRTLQCEEYEAMLADALDGSLTAADLAAFQCHDAGCPGCTELLTRATQGQEWLRFLAQPPVAPDLVSRILAKTSGMPTTLSAVGAVDAVIPYPVAAAVPFWRQVIPWSSIKRLAEPRLMMTTAMAFFSIALTLNLAGVRLTAVRLSDLNPSQLRSNLTRQFRNSKVGVENYCYNLKIVYEMEARMRELKRNSEEEQPPQPAPVAPKGAGSAHKGGGKSENPRNAGPRLFSSGRTVDAALRGGEFSARFPFQGRTFSGQPARGVSGFTRIAPAISRTDEAARSLA